MWKEGVQTAITNNLDVFKYVSEKVWSYNTTPHSTTDVSPYMLSRGRKPTSSFSPSWLKNKMGGSNDQPIDLYKIREHVKERQRLYKENYNKRKHVKVTHLAPGDWVLIKKPIKVCKGQTKFSEAARIVKVSKMAVMLQNRGWWNRNALIKLTAEQAKIISRKVKSQTNSDWFNLGDLSHDHNDVKNVVDYPSVGGNRGEGDISVPCGIDDNSEERTTPNNGAQGDCKQVRCSSHIRTAPFRSNDFVYY